MLISIVTYITCDFPGGGGGSGPPPPSGSAHAMVVIIDRRLNKSFASSDNLYIQCTN